MENRFDSKIWQRIYGTASEQSARKCAGLPEEGELEHVIRHAQFETGFLRPDQYRAAIAFTIGMMFEKPDAFTTNHYAIFLFRDPFNEFTKSAFGIDVGVKESQQELETASGWVATNLSKFEAQDRLAILEDLDSLRKLGGEVFKHFEGDIELFEYFLNAATKTKSA